MPRCMRTTLLLSALLLFVRNKHAVSQPSPPHGGHDVCSYIRYDPMWSSTHYMPTVLERTLKRKGGKLGPFHCPVCGSAYAYAADWDPNALRETGRCSICGESNRRRQLAYIVNHVASEWARREISSIVEVGQLNMAIYNTEVEGAIHEFLREGDQYVSSTYLGPQYTPGQLVEDIRHEDLQQLSMDNNTFDLVLSADVFEYIPQPYKAHREVFRVLKPGGSHVFTVPYAPNSRNDIIKAFIAANGSVVFHGAPELHREPAHPDGLPLFRVFGRGEMLRELCDIGFEVMDFFLQSPNHGIIAGGSHVFRARKPLAKQCTTVDTNPSQQDIDTPGQKGQHDTWVSESLGTGASTTNTVQQRQSNVRAGAFHRHAFVDALEEDDGADDEVDEQPVVNKAVSTVLEGGAQDAVAAVDTIGEEAEERTGGGVHEEESKNTATAGENVNQQGGNVIEQDDADAEDRRRFAQQFGARAVEQLALKQQQQHEGGHEDSAARYEEAEEVKLKTDKGHRVDVRQEAWDPLQEAQAIEAISDKLHSALARKAQQQARAGVQQHGNGWGVDGETAFQSEHGDGSGEGDGSGSNQGQGFIADMHQEGGMHEDDGTQKAQQGVDGAGSQPRKVDRVVVKVDRVLQPTRQVAPKRNTVKRGAANKEGAGAQQHGIQETGKGQEEARPAEQQQQRVAEQQQHVKVERQGANVAHLAVERAAVLLDDD